MAVSEDGDFTQRHCCSNRFICHHDYSMDRMVFPLKFREICFTSTSM